MPTAEQLDRKDNLFAWRVGAAVFFAAVAAFFIAYFAGWLDFSRAPVKGGRSASAPDCPIPAYTERRDAGAAPKIGADCSVTATDPVTLVFDEPFTGNRARMTIKGRFNGSKVTAFLFATDAAATNGWVIRHHHEFLGPGVLSVDVCRTVSCPTEGPGYLPFTNYKGTIAAGSPFAITVEVDRSTGKGDTIRTWAMTTPATNPGGDIAYTADGFSFAGPRMGIQVSDATVFAVTIEGH